MLPTSFPPPAPWDLRISLRPVPAPWRTCRQPHIRLYMLTAALLHITLVSKRSYSIFHFVRSLKTIWMPIPSCSNVYRQRLFFYLPWRVEEVIAELLTEALQRPLMRLKTKPWDINKCGLFLEYVTSMSYLFISLALPPLKDWSCLERCRLRLYALLPVGQ